MSLVTKCFDCHQGPAECLPQALQSGDMRACPSSWAWIAPSAPLHPSVSPDCSRLGMAIVVAVAGTVVAAAESSPLAGEALAAAWPCLHTGMDCGRGRGRDCQSAGILRDSVRQEAAIWWGRLFSGGHLGWAGPGWGRCTWRRRWRGDAGYWMLDVGCWMRDARCWVLGATATENGSGEHVVAPHSRNRKILGHREIQQATMPWNKSMP